MKFYKNMQELDAELKNSTMDFNTFINQKQEAQIRTEIINKISDLKNSNLLNNALTTLNQSSNNNQNDLLNALTTIFKYLTVLENFHENCLSKTPKESFFKKISTSSLLILTVTAFKVIQK